MIDAGINFILGILLLLTILFPERIAKFLGIPAVKNAFYPSILGAVLFGIGIALVLESYRTKPEQLVGLGLGGAVAINLCGGAVLIGWLIFGDLHLPVRGMVFLWSIGLILISISGYELLMHARKTRSS
ncbi:MAG: hypothetical protein MUO57_15400 [Anaerolineales bacterium]|nr:hypothetical protein [Anaerolineales bacterium]